MLDIVFSALTLGWASGTASSQ